MGRIIEMEGSVGEFLRWMCGFVVGREIGRGVEGGIRAGMAIESWLKGGCTNR